jgi:hypothetical protein
MKLLVTTPPLSTFDTIYLVDQDRTVSRIQPLPFPDLTIASTLQLQKPPIALLQLRYQILDLLIFKYLKGGDFENAMCLISICTTTLRRFYYRLYGQYYPPGLLIQLPPTITSIHYRISKTIHLCSMIYDALVTFQNEEMDQYFGIQVFLSEQKSPLQRFYPWDFVNNDMEIVDTTYPFLHDTDRPIDHSFITGPYFAQIAWVNGKTTKHGLIHSNYFRMPVCPLIFTSRQNELLLTPDFLDNSLYFRGFHHLLLLCLGPCAGIFFQVTPVRTFTLYEYSK